jgi:pimeloyl-ACP methyl ester carboxylesterase
VLVALHGGPGNCSDYLVSLERLASTSLTVVTYDQRGTGRSTRPPEEPSSYTMPKYVADLEAVRMAVGAERMHLMGHSWGGQVALRYAVAYPDRVQSIILAGSGVLTAEAAQEGQRSKGQRVAALQEQGVIPEAIRSLSDLLPAYFSDPSFEMPSELKSMFYDPAVEQMTWQALEGYDLTSGLGEVDQRVLVLWGEDDPFGRAYIESTKGVLSDAELQVVTLEDCGHYWHECPAPFYWHVRAFLGLGTIHGAPGQ